MFLRYNRNLYILLSVLLLCVVTSGCSVLKGAADDVKDGLSKPDTADTEEMTQEQLEQAERDEEIIDSPYLVDAEYFRKTAGKNKPINLFGDSEREKELEERLAKLEKRMQGIPERATDRHGLPVLRRKVVLLSLLGDLGLDVLSLLPASLRRTDGIVPVDASMLAELLREQGRTVADLASVSTRREIAAIAGIQAYILVYFPQGNGSADAGKKAQLRLDVIHATESVLIGSYLATIDEFDNVAVKISKDVVRGTDWSCRIINVEDDGKAVILNSGRLTGLQPGDRLRVYGLGKEIIDSITKRSLGYGPGKFKGELQVESLFGTDAAKANVISGGGMRNGDVVKMAELAY
jgi:predicted small secreted protein